MDYIAYYKTLFQDEESAKELLWRASQSWVEPDKKVLSAPGVIEIMSASLVEAIRKGATGAAYDGTSVGLDFLKSIMIQT